MGQLAEATANPMVQEFAARLTQRALPMSSFLCPSLPVDSFQGRYMDYRSGELDQFRLMDLRKVLGKPAVQLGSDSANATYKAVPYAIDFPVDMTVQWEGEALENLLMRGAAIIYSAALTNREYHVFQTGLSGMIPGNTSTSTWSGNSTTDPVAVIDNVMLTLAKNCFIGGSDLFIKMIFGAQAWVYFKNNAQVRSKFVVGVNAPGGVGGGPALAIPNAGNIPRMLNIGGMFALPSQSMVGFMAYNSTGPGGNPTPTFILNNQVLVFVSSENISREDPSFMKSFQPKGHWFVPHIYMKEDQRTEVAAFDWSEDIKVTNPNAAWLITVS